MTQTPPVRRQLEQPSAEKQGRPGCLITGAVLGIIVGATFAFYGLPPILRYYYGEKTVAVGETYSGDAKTLRVVEAVRVAIDPGDGSVLPWFVTVEVLTNKTWRPEADDFSLEVDGVDEWVVADEVSLLNGAGDPSDAGAIPLGKPALVMVRFEPPAGAKIEDATHLHLSEPRLKFELPVPAGP